MQFNLTLFKCLLLNLLFCDIDDSSHYELGGKLFETQNVVSLLLGQESVSVFRLLSDKALVLFIEVKQYAIVFFEIFLNNHAFFS